MTARIVFVLLLLTSSVVHSAEALLLSTHEETGNYIWFCPACCPEGKYCPEAKRQAGVFWYKETEFGEILKHLRENHQKEKESFYEGVLRSVPNGSIVTGKAGAGRRIRAKSFLAGIFPDLDSNPDRVLTENDYSSKGMVRVSIREFSIKFPSQPSKRPRNNEYKPDKRQKIQHEPQDPGQQFVAQLNEDLAALEAAYDILGDRVNNS